MKTNNQKIIMAVGYCRVSTDRQREESLDHQQHEIQKYADEHNIQIIRWYKDFGFSATNNNRPEFQRMLNDSRLRKFSKVLVWKFDRFSRDVCEGAIAKHELRENGVSVFSVIERVENTPEGQLIEGIFERLNEYYVKNLARGVLGGMKENAYNGVSNGSCTFGYMSTPKLDENGNPIRRSISGGKTKTVNVFAIHPKNAEAVKLIFAMALAGAERNQIAARLKELGYKNASGNDFNGTHIDKILRNERYTGVYIFECNKGKQVNYLEREVIRIDGGMPKIIEKEDFDKVQAMLNARKHRPNSHSLVDYLLTGKVVCGECGGQFTGSTHYKNGQPYFYYRCKRKNQDCKIISVRQEALENFVLAEIKNIIHNEDFVTSILDRFTEFYREKNQNNAVIKGLEKSLQDVEKQIANITNVIANSGKFDNIFQAKLDELTDEKIKLLESLQRETSIGLTEFVSKDNIRRSYFKVLQLLETGNTEDKRTIINTLLNRVIVYKDRVEIFVNILPLDDASAEMQITDKDLTEYGLLETTQNENTAQMDDIPSNISAGRPVTRATSNWETTRSGAWLVKANVKQIYYRSRD